MIFPEQPLDHLSVPATRYQGAPLSQVSMFVPQVHDGFRWPRIAAPQDDARSACRVVTEYIRLLDPECDHESVECAAHGAALELEAGARSAAVVSVTYRVERLELPKEA